MKYSVVVPLYNEEACVYDLVEQTRKALSNLNSCELILVDDGSTDNTYAELKKIAAQANNIKIVSFPSNRGQGQALIAGFKVAKGEFVITLDADLSYDPADIPKLIEKIKCNDLLDIVIGSPYVPGGKVTGVPFWRIMLSKIANKLIGLALPGRIRTVTGMFRIYRQPILDSIEMESDGKEIHFEILSKTLAVGAKVAEIPSILRGRERGESKTRIKSAIVSHMLFSFFERPAILFEIIGLLMFLLGIASGIYIIVLWQQHALQPTRPLMLLMVLLIVVGSIILSFAFIASQIVKLRKEIYQIQKENLYTKRLILNKKQRSQ